MKKAQILSAIALAFALGVVAPVAGVSAVCPITIEVRATAEATEQEGQNAVAYVSSNATYKKVAKVASEIAKYWGTDGTDSENGVDPTLTVTVANIKAHMDALNGKSVDGATGDAKIASTYNSGETNLGALANNAKATTNYDLYASLINEMAKDATDFKASVVAGIVAQMRTQGIVASNFDLSTWGDTASADVTVTTKQNVLDALSSAANADDYAKVANYTAYKALVNDVTNITNYATAYEAIAPAIAAAVDTTAGTAASDANVEYTTTIADLVDEADDANITGYTVWSAVYTAATDVLEDQSKANRYTDVVALARAWKTALPETDCLANVIAEEMMAYAGGTTDPTDPEGPNDTDKPGDADDNKGDGTNPGNTGVVSNTNGTASSTVAVVAGIATALTAAGAGVVAYRNARREA